MSGTVTLGNSVNIITLAGFTSLVGGSMADTVAVTGALSGSTVDLGGGLDKLTLGNGGYTLTISNAETITSGTGADDVTLGAAVSGATINLG
ncbi:hypothetical protein JMJ55_09500, partial [Belnapia sp. T6]|nr:hypothetical protein [Belnapia mucosa]